MSDDRTTEFEWLNRVAEDAETDALWHELDRLADEIQARRWAAFEHAVDYHIITGKPYSH